MKKTILTILCLCGFVCLSYGNANFQKEYEMGIAYYTGKGVPQNYATAIPLLRKAAENGHIPAQAIMIDSYLKGNGVRQDYTQAFRWATKIAEQNNPIGMHTLSLFYLGGIGVAKDNYKALVWLKKAADRGHSQAQYDLAIHYLDGKGVPKDINKGVSYLKLASKQGHSNAIEHLDIMTTMSSVKEEAYKARKKQEFLDNYYNNLSQSQWHELAASKRMKWDSVTKRWYLPANTN